MGGINSGQDDNRLLFYFSCHVEELFEVLTKHYMIYKP